MRPVNLIPTEDRKQKAQVRTGSIAYLLVGALALGLAAVTMLVLTGNKIADRETEIADLRQQESEAAAEAQELASFTSFSAVEQQRRATVKSLADSRFDWERVMNELALVIPGDVWLTDLTGVASAASGATGAETPSPGSSSIAGPSLQLSGCAAGQEAVAGFLSALRDIDGITRVGLSSSERPSQEVTNPEGGGGSECRTRDFIAKFEIVAAFDAVPVPPVAAGTPAAPVAETAPPESGTAAPPESGTAPATEGETTPAAETGS